MEPAINREASDEGARERAEQQLRLLRQKASYLLQWAGLRLMTIAGEMVCGIWSDRDSRNVRRALAIFGSAEREVRYLDGPAIPDRYKERRVAGTPVPMNVLQAMMMAAAGGLKPWEVRDKMLADMDYHYPPLPFPVDWAGGRYTVVAPEAPPYPPSADLVGVSRENLKVWLKRDSERWLIHHELRTQKDKIIARRRRGFQTVTRDHAMRVAYLWYGIAPEQWKEDKHERQTADPRLPQA